ncbi:hypothetical protein ACH5RR_011496 [Cinchona calisaya]|uniref:Exostosin GT47 domain-containing protein n=1 Tax=Cinchona calisaya TaxID=153742 RepID=A0ABD3A8H6_9GENT
MHPFARFSSTKRNFLDKPKNRRAWLFVALLLPILLLLFFTSAPKHYYSFRRLQQRFRAPLNGQCKYGTVYVYDLPPIFNKKLLDNFQDLDLSNDGFGPKATDLEGVIPKDLTPAWYSTDKLAGEVMFHSRISNYKCRTYDPDSATAFYIPCYAGLASRKHLNGNFSASERDSQFESLLGWLTNQPSWKKSKGADHFIILGRISSDFRRDSEEKSGSSFLLMPPMSQTLRLSIERSPWDRLDIGMPYPTGFHPKSNSEVEKWLKFVRTRNRSKLFAFVGGKSKKIEDEDFRDLLLDQCKGFDSCKVVESEAASPAILEAYLDSNFCLQPRGDEGFGYTSRSTFDCMLAGSIPVFFWKRSIHGQYEWFLRDDPERFSVFVEEKQVRNGSSIRKVLEGYGEEEIQMMRERVSNLIPRFLYYAVAAAAGGGKEKDIRDAFEITVEGVLRRIKEASISQQ